MKKLLTPVLALFLMLGMTQNMDAQVRTPAPSPGAKVEQDVGMTTISLDFSRPAARGRSIYGGLVPYDKIWRTGANASTKITLGSDANVGGKDIKAGTYALYTIPGKSSWTVMLYSDLSLGGNVNGYDEKNEVARFTVKPNAWDGMIESFSMGFANVTDHSTDLWILWEKTMVVIPITVDTEGEVMASIEKTMAGPGAGDYRAAANYYANNDKDMDQALEWINKCMEMGGDQYFWMVTDRARILAKMGKKDEAKTAAMAAMELAKKAGNSDYIKINEDIIAGL